MRKTIQIGVYETPEMIEKLRAKAEVEGASLSSFCRRILRGVLNE